MPSVQTPSLWLPSYGIEGVAAYLRRARTAGGGGISDPTDVAGCKLWLDAGQIGGLVDDDPVGSWPDASGQGNDGSVQVGSFRPRWRTNVVNGLPVVRFNGTDTYTVTLPDFMSGFTAGTMFWVLKNSTSSNMSMSHWGTNADQDYYPFAGDSQVYLGDGSTARKSCGTPPFGLDSAFHILTINSASGAWSVRLAGAAFFSTATNTVAFDASPEIGRNVWAGDIAEVVVYDSALGTTDRDNVEAYLASKYGL